MFKFFSSSSTFFITLNSCRAHDGQEITFTPRCLKFRDFKILKPTFISSTGSADKDTLMVSPIPAHNSEPKPIDDFIVPAVLPPASVMPK